jgi:hypothetical protein
MRTCFTFAENVTSFPKPTGAYWRFQNICATMVSISGRFFVCPSEAPTAEEDANQEKEWKSDESPIDRNRSR